jgi:hypothetical protein
MSQLVEITLFSGADQVSHPTFVTPYSTVRSGIRRALSLRYVDLVVSIEVAVAVCCCFTVFSCFKQRLKCNTGKVCNGLIQFLLYRRSWTSLPKRCISAQRLSERTVQ